ncbi:hypothetical protein [Streptomyces olivoreticuli]|uniref:hypothetical protein n=1 Tax=Streptomyces olivoreticuli TaxID=68246 RepID=UPI0013C34FF4|nr:hypothetical protein [Streptomyces olivoreticuli]
MARRKTRASGGPSNEALRIARTIAYYGACLDRGVTHEQARALWAHDMTRPFTVCSGDMPLALLARLEAEAQRDAGTST